MKNSMSIFFKNLFGIMVLFKYYIININVFDVVWMIKVGK